jgi:hypothetical protein
MESSLKDRVAKVGRSAGVDMNPNRPIPPPPKEEDIPPDIRELVTGPDLRSLTVMVTEHAELGMQISGVKKQRDALSAKIKNLLGKHEISQCMCEGNRVNYYGGERHTIKSSLLLDHGVSPAVIEACTEVKVTYTLRITPPGSDNRDE